MRPISLHGQVAIVTGGGRGLGRAYCLELARLGASVVVNEVVSERCDAVVAEIAANGRAVASYDSVASLEGGRAIVRTALDHFGTVDVVVNNAGTMSNGFFEDQTPEMLSAMLDVHIAGAFFVTQAAWPIMRKKAYGRVILTSSGGGMFAMQGEANYAAAKAGVYGLCKALAFEGKPDGILVNALLPGAITDIVVDYPVPGLSERFSPGLSEILAPRRLPEAVAAFVGFLSSQECEVTGEAFKADAGVYSRVFVGVTPGWVAADASKVNPDDILEHFGEIRDLDGYSIPEDNYEFAEILGRRVGWTG
jgi:NAD(P)-dependent dehydrogenase (short-subunit alcohol dehydrogenase family)